MTVGLVYDLGVVQQAARGDATVWTLHRAALSNHILPTIPSVVVGEANVGRQRRLLVEFLSACAIGKISEQEAYLTGRALRLAGSTLVADATVVARALWHGDVVVTTHPESHAKLAESLGFQLTAITVQPHDNNK